MSSAALIYTALVVWDLGCRRFRLRERMESKHARLICLCFALFCVFGLWGTSLWVAATRIHDYWHRPADVICGHLIGAACARLAHAVFFQKLSHGTYVPLSAQNVEVEMV